MGGNAHVLTIPWQKSLYPECMPVPGGQPEHITVFQIHSSFSSSEASVVLYLFLLISDPFVLSCDRNALCAYNNQSRYVDCQPTTEGEYGSLTSIVCSGTDTVSQGGRQSAKGQVEWWIGISIVLACVLRSYFQQMSDPSFQHVHRQHCLITLAIDTIIPSQYSIYAFNIHSVLCTLVATHDCHERYLHD